MNLVAIPQVSIPLTEALRLAAQERIAGRLEAAEALLAAALETAPDSAEVRQAMALVAFARGELPRAQALAAAALAAEPDRAGWWRNACTIHERAGDYAAALEAARQAARLDPDQADHWHALAVVEYRLRAVTDCIAHARTALARDPDHPGAHVLLGEALLLGGDFAPGWEELAWRFRLPGAPPVAPVMPCPQWDGAALAGRLLVVADQGYGDAIQFARYLPWAGQRCAAMTLLAAPEFAALFGAMVPGGDVRTEWAALAGAMPGLAAWVPLSELPRLAGTRADTIPAAPAYLVADPAGVAGWRARFAALARPGTRRVGLVWSGRPTHPNDASRSAPAAALAPLAAVPGVSLVSLQRGEAAAEWATLGPAGAAFGGAIADFADAAAAIAALDLLITVDSAPAHLAGALGRPAWVMLPYGPDWRWGAEGAASPWYPSLRLFRPDRPRGWAGLAENLAAALKNLPPIA
ncbi:MAG: tetratricopeptide repeat protein [Rhodospirillales bacterium]|nr:tetratricopeptide repeat protein [Rhodospirillales bacterium]